MTTGQAVRVAPAQGRADWARPFLVGALAGVVALAVGAVLAVVLVALGLTTTGIYPLNTWLAGGGLLGGWSQSVSATVAGGIEWNTWVAGAPMLVTLAVIGVVAAMARRTSLAPLPGALLAAGGAGVVSLLLVLASSVTAVSSNEAGTVTTREGLTVLWTGASHPGTVLGAVLLVGGTWWINTEGLAWWRGGAALVKGLLIIPGLILTVVVAGAVTYLSSSPALGVATILLFPLIGVAAVVGLGGAPADAGITRLSPEPYHLWIWANPWYGVVGLIAVLAIAVIVGLGLRARGHGGSWVDGITVTALSAAFITWATDSVVDVPAALGGQTRLEVNPVAAMVVAGIMAAVALLVRGRRRLPEGASGAAPQSKGEHSD